MTILNNVSVNGLPGYHFCHLLLTPSLMPHILHSLMDMFLSIRTNSGISALLSPLESAVCNHLLPKLVPHAVSDIERELFSFPVRFGGLGICNPVSTSEEQHGIS